MTVRQACIQSGISHEAYYRRCREDTDFADKMYFAQQSVLITARKNVIKAIKDGDLRASQWWLEKHEFNKKQEEPQQAAMPAQIDPVKGQALIARFKAYEEEVLYLQREKVQAAIEP